MRQKVLPEKKLMVKLLIHQMEMIIILNTNMALLLKNFQIKQYIYLQLTDI